jgi:hypothetical protein
VKCKILLAVGIYNMDLVHQVQSHGMLTIQDCPFFQ